MSKPVVKDMKPVALTNTSYIMLMDIVRDKIDDHLDKNHMTVDTQLGSVRVRRTEGTSNFLTLRYCILNIFRSKKTLLVISIDFQKTFDYKKT